MQKFVWNSICRLTNPLYQNRSCRLFHSTPSSFAKWRGKFVQDAKDQDRGTQPSKNYIRYVVRRKRADAKRALNDFLLKGSYSRQSVQDEWEDLYADTKRILHGKAGCHENDDYNHFSSNLFRRCKRKRTPSNKTRWNRKKSKVWTFVSEDEEMHPETTFKASFTGNHCRWSFKSRAQGPGTGFKWKDSTSWASNGKSSSGTREETENATNNFRRGCESESDFDSEDEPVETEVSQNSSLQRTILGLPPTGQLMMDDIKTAFRASALKWHPDKHQGPAQIMAGEKFKLCMEAYHSLCSSLKSR